MIPVPELYEICLTARDILKGKHGVGRVIARPFLGTNASNLSAPITAVIMPGP